MIRVKEFPNLIPKSIPSEREVACKRYAVVIINVNWFVHPLSFNCWSLMEMGRIRRSIGSVPLRNNSYVFLIGLYLEFVLALKYINYFPVKRIPVKVQCSPRQHPLLLAVSTTYKIDNSLFFLPCHRALRLYR